MIIYLEETLKHIARVKGVEEANALISSGEVQQIEDIKYIKIIEE